MSLQNSSEPQCVALPISEGALEVQVRVERSARARTMRLFLNHAREVVIRLPKRQSLRSAEAFLLAQSQWIASVLKNTPQTPSLSEHFDKHGFVSALGRCYSVNIQPSRVKSSYVFFPEAQEICFRLFENDEPNVALLKLLNQFAQEVVVARTWEFAKRYELMINNVSVRNQNTRWGSCSSSGTISLNWRLVLLPHELHDHVVFHELAHVRQMNHSRAFYDLLEEYDPQSTFHSKKLTKVSDYYMRLAREV